MNNDLLDEFEIQRLISRYNRLLDDGKVGELIELFTEDAVMHSMGHTYRGRAELEIVWAQSPAAGPDRPSMTHHVSNVAVMLHGNEAQAESDFMVLRRTEAGAFEILMVGRFRDRLRRTGSGWRFVERSPIALGRSRS